jgi:hypothetical protein
MSWSSETVCRACISQRAFLATSPVLVASCVSFCNTIGRSTMPDELVALSCCLQCGYYPTVSDEITSLPCCSSCTCMWLPSRVHLEILCPPVPNRNRERTNLNYTHYRLDLNLHIIISFSAHRITLSPRHHIPYSLHDYPALSGDGQALQTIDSDQSAHHRMARIP